MHRSPTGRKEQVCRSRKKFDLMTEFCDDEAKTADEGQILGNVEPLSARLELLDLDLWIASLQIYSGAENSGTSELFANSKSDRLRFIPGRCVRKRACCSTSAA